MYILRSLLQDLNCCNMHPMKLNIERHRTSSIVFVGVMSFKINVL